jgi:hypothetical protein
MIPHQFSPEHAASSHAHHPSHAHHSSADVIMRTTAVVALFGIVVIHFVQLVPTFKAMPLLGFAYVGLIGAALVVGARLVTAGATPLRLWAPVAAVGALALGGYAFTRMISTPLDTQDVGNWACTLGMSALAVEGLLVALSVYATKVGSSLPGLATSPIRTPAMTPSVIVVEANGRTTATHLGQFDGRVLDSGAAQRGR